MAKASRHAVTDFSPVDSVYLKLGDIKFPISQFVASFPLNSLPQATCVLAIGRNARDTTKRSTIHDNPKLFQAMTPAKVYGKFRGQYKPDTAWPAVPAGDGFLLFDGYVSGFSYRKVNGKINAVVQLHHWLIDMTMSSTLSEMLHPGTDNSLRERAIMALSSDIGVSQTVSQGSFVSNRTGFDSVSRWLRGDRDLWRAMKQYMTLLANTQFLGKVFEGELASQQLTSSGTNTQALSALARIEGPLSNDAAYLYGKAVQFKRIAPDIETAIHYSLSQLSIANVAHHTFWDVLIGGWLPTFGLELRPQIDRAVIAPSVPAYRDSTWRVLQPSEYVAIDEGSMIPKPLRAVMIYGNVAGNALKNETMQVRLGGIASFGTSGSIIALRCPSWIVSAPYLQPGLTASSSGVKSFKAISTADSPGTGTTPTATDKTSPEELTNLMSEYAAKIFVENALRGRTGTVSGRLRFDIAPGSHIKIEGSPERFIGGEDQLGGSVYAQVHRVTISINADVVSPSAMTSLGLSFVRSEEENKEDATSMAVPPFFTPESMTKGLPLLPIFDLP